MSDMHGPVWRPAETVELLRCDECRAAAADAVVWVETLQFHRVAHIEGAYRVVAGRVDVGFMAPDPDDLCTIVAAVTAGARLYETSVTRSTHLAAVDEAMSRVQVAWLQWRREGP
jgi:hypothetical protein